MQKGKQLSSGERAAGRYSWRVPIQEPFLQTSLPGR